MGGALCIVMAIITLGYDAPEDGKPLINGWAQVGPTWVNEDGRWQNKDGPWTVLEAPIGVDGKVVAAFAEEEYQIVPCGALSLKLTDGMKAALKAAFVPTAEVTESPWLSVGTVVLTQKPDLPGDCISNSGTVGIVVLVMFLFSVDRVGGAHRGRRQGRRGLRRGGISDRAVRRPLSQADRWHEGGAQGRLRANGRSHGVTVVERGHRGAHPEARPAWRLHLQLWHGGHCGPGYVPLLRGGADGGGPHVRRRPVRLAPRTRRRLRHGRRGWQLGRRHRHLDLLQGLRHANGHWHPLPGHHHPRRDALLLRSLLP